MLWYVVVAAVVAATQGQHLVRYDGTPIVDDSVSSAQPASSQAPAPSVQSVVIATSATQPQLPAPQPALYLAKQAPAPQVVLSQRGFPRQTIPPFFPLSVIHARHLLTSYHFSWYHHPGHVYTHQQAVDYCSSNNHFGQLFHFEVLRIDDMSELRFIISLLDSHFISAMWTRDTIHTAAYSIRHYINRSGSSNPGDDCLSVEGAHHNIRLRQDTCLHGKWVICEVHLSHGVHL